jgi:hypothetical protein
MLRGGDVTSEEGYGLNIDKFHDICRDSLHLTWQRIDDEGEEEVLD